MYGKIRFEQAQVASARLCGVALVLILLFGASPVTISAQDDKPAEKKKIEWMEAEVLVVDPDGNPVKDATVFCTGLRTSAEPGSHFWYSEDRFGKPPRIKTDEKGIAKMPYPAFIDEYEELPVTVATWSVEHPSFVAFREDREVNLAPAKIELTRGYRIAATAIDAQSGEKFKKNLYGHVGGWEYVAWELKSNGMLISDVLATTNKLCRVTRIEKGKPTLFSELLELDTEGKSRILLRNVELKRGVRVEGRLDAAVPRPVKNGLVIYHVTISQEVSRSWRWSGLADIEADGTFVLESVPDGGALQVIAICDGWVSKNPKRISVLRHFPEQGRRFDGTGRNYPRLFSLDDAEESADVRLKTIEIEMEKTVTVEATVFGPDNKPLENAKVFMWPNQIVFDLGSQILGQGFSTETFLSVPRDQWDLKQTKRFEASTDVNGKAIIRNLPRRTGDDIAATLDGYRMGETSVSLNEDLNKIRINLIAEGDFVARRSWGKVARDWIAHARWFFGA